MQSKNRLLIWMGVLLVLISSAVIPLNSHSLCLTSLGQGLKETTIRNVTGKKIRYTITPVGSNSQPEKRILQPGDIDRFLDFTNFDVEYKRAKMKISRRIYRGRPYSFRLNEDEKLELYDGSHGREDAPDLAPYVPTPLHVVEKMLELAKVKSGDILYDLGCGDGRIVITAAAKCGARGVGVDIDPLRISESRAKAILAGVENLVEFHQQDVMNVDFSEATVLAVYLLPESLEQLRPLFEKTLKPGTLVVSHNYAIQGWEEREVDYFAFQEEGVDTHVIYLYRK